MTSEFWVDFLIAHWAQSRHIALKLHDASDRGSCQPLSSAVSVLRGEPHLACTCQKGWAWLALPCLTSFTLKTQFLTLGHVYINIQWLTFSWSFYFNFYFDPPKMDYQEYLSSFRLVPLLSFIFLFSCEVPDAELSEWTKNALAMKCKSLALINWKVCGYNVGQQIKHLPIEQKYRSKGTC